MALHILVTITSTDLVHIGNFLTKYRQKPSAFECAEHQIRGMINPSSMCMGCLSCESE